MDKYGCSRKEQLQAWLKSKNEKPKKPELGLNKENQHTNTVHTTNNTNNIPHHSNKRKLSQTAPILTSKQPNTHANEMKPTLPTPAVIPPTVPPTLPPTVPPTAVATEKTTIKVNASTQTEEQSSTTDTTYITSLQQELTTLRAQLEEAKTLEEAYIFSHEILLQQIGEQRGKFNKLLQDEYQSHANQINGLKADHANYEALMSNSIDEFRASTVTILKGHIDNVNLLTLESAELKRQNAELVQQMLPGNVYE